MPVYVEARELRKTFGNVVAVDNVSLAFEEGHLTTLLGPSGCGKTTTLRCIAGLERPDSGEIQIAGEPVVSTKMGVYVPPEKRGIGMVFQSYAVWPHMTVFDNVAFPLRMRHEKQEEVRRKVIEVLDLVGLHGLHDRYATKLSGGQQQRVAVARALVFRPRLLLFDEPLSNLDAKLRERMRVELLRLQREVGITSIYVTHDQEEAMAISDKIVVMQAGRVEQVGDPRSIYRNPANPFVADFIGIANLLEGTVTEVRVGEAAVEVSDGVGSHLLSAATEAPVEAGSKVLLCLRRERVRLHSAPPSNGQNVLAGRLVNSQFLGDHTDCRVQVGAREIRVKGSEDQAIALGQDVYLTFSPSDCILLQ